MVARLICAEVTDALSAMADGTFHCVVTSPPYYGLRDYGVVGQMGLEPSIQIYLANMVHVFAEVRRVLRPDGTVWLNMGDSYRNKQLLGMPWRLALALQADGWWLRSEIVWHKPNPMPSSVRDRPQTAHEFVFLLTASPVYFYDADAVTLPTTGNAHSRGKGVHPKASTWRRPSGWDTRSGSHTGKAGRYPQERMNPSYSASMTQYIPARRNLRSVWTIPTQGYRGAHYATYPEALVEPCVLAGTSAEGCCAACGASRRRVTDVTYDNPGNRSTNGPRSLARRHMAQGSAGYAQRLERHTVTTGWEPSCTCAGETVPCRVLDPFVGSGTTGVVALRHGREFVGVDLDPRCIDMARRRISGDAPLLNSVEMAGATCD